MYGGNIFLITAIWNIWLDRMREVYDLMGYNYATHVWAEEQELE